MALITVMAAAALVLSAAAASAGTLAPAGAGKAAAFRFTYPEGDTTWSCQGVHIENANGTSEDEEACHVTGITAADRAAYPSGVYSGDPSGAFPFIVPAQEWCSDYWESVNGSCVVATRWRIFLVELGNTGTGTILVSSSYAAELRSRICVCKLSHFHLGGDGFVTVW